MRLDSVLALEIEDLERRLQTQVCKSGLAKSIHYPRTLIRQRDIRVGPQIVSVPPALCGSASGAVQRHFRQWYTTKQVLPGHPARGIHSAGPSTALSRGAAVPGVLFLAPMRSRCFQHSCGGREVSRRAVMSMSEAGVRQFSY
ncbi:hypothetical protein FB451DRAFT_679662 [Mycena latifolia]|nr:hypothetical protein FB451DRAFT_679662 [Mycena latifolia]